MKYQTTKIKKVLARKLRNESTKSEQIMWLNLRNNKFRDLKFRRQHVILGYIVDFYCPQLKLVIEIDGEIHQSQLAEDLIRQKALEAVGLRVFRISSREIENDINVSLSKLNIYLQNLEFDYLSYVQNPNL